MGVSITGSEWVWRKHCFSPGSPYPPSSLPNPCQERPKGPLLFHSQTSHFPTWSCRHLIVVPRGSCLVTRTPKPFLSVMHRTPLLGKLVFLEEPCLFLSTSLTQLIPRGPTSVRDGSPAGSEATTSHFGDFGEAPGRLQMTACLITPACRTQIKCFIWLQIR